MGVDVIIVMCIVVALIGGGVAAEIDDRKSGDRNDISKSKGRDCAKCNVTVQNGAQFCHRCGNALA